MGDPLQASNAWAMGNLGLTSALRDESDVDSYDVEDVADQYHASLWARSRWRLFRWALAAGVFVAFISHWPGGAN